MDEINKKAEVKLPEIPMVEEETIKDNSADSIHNLDCANADQTETEVEVEVEITNEIKVEAENEIDAVADNEIKIEAKYEVETENEVEVTRDDFNLVLEEFDLEKREDQAWQERTGLNPDTLCGALETVIFMSDRPVALIKMRDLIDEDLPLRVLHEAIGRLQEEYESKHHGLRLLEVAEGYQFRTKATYSKYVQDLFKVNSLVLTPSALEVLAIIAYKQPVSKTKIEKIRGVDSSHIVRGLIEKRLVKMMGRSEEIGRPTQYGTTSEFLEVFNLADLNMLPSETELEELSQTSIGKISDIKTICNGDKKVILNLDELEELDRLSLNIKNISSDTDFTHSLKLEEKKRTNSLGEPIKSVFDLLEEHIAKKLITESNLSAALSNLLSAAVSPSVIHDLEEGPFNTPEIEEDEEWQMIDLDTGETIDDWPETLDTLGEEDSGDVESSIEVEDEEPQNDLANIFSEDGEDEGESLAKALEAAFLNMQTSKTASFEEDDNNELDNVNKPLEDSYKLSEETSENAKDLDLDISFLNDDSSD